MKKYLVLIPVLLAGFASGCSADSEETTGQATSVPPSASTSAVPSTSGSVAPSASDSVAASSPAAEATGQPSTNGASGQPLTEVHYTPSTTPTPPEPSKYQFGIGAAFQIGDDQDTRVYCTIGMVDGQLRCGGLSGQVSINGEPPTADYKGFVYYEGHFLPAESASDPLPGFWNLDPGQSLTYDGVTCEGTSPAGAQCTVDGKTVSFSKNSYSV